MADYSKPDHFAFPVYLQELRDRKAALENELHARLVALANARKKPEQPTRK